MIKRKRKKIESDQKRYTKKMVQERNLPYTLKFDQDNNPDLSDYNDRHIEYCIAYATFLDHKKAAIKAGYKAKTAMQKGASLYLLPKNKAYINYLLQEKRKQYKPTQDRIIKELSKVAFFDFSSLIDSDYPNIDIHNLTEDQSAGIDSITVTTKEIKTQETELPEIINVLTNIKFIKYKDKEAALKMLGQHLGMQLEVQPASSKIINNIPVQNDYKEQTLRELSADELRQLTTIYGTAEAKAVEKHRSQLGKEGTC